MTSRYICELEVYFCDQYFSYHAEVKLIVTNCLAKTLLAGHNEIFSHVNMLKFNSITQ